MPVSVSVYRVPPIVALIVRDPLEKSGASASNLLTLLAVIWLVVTPLVAPPPFAANPPMPVPVKVRPGTGPPPPALLEIALMWNPPAAGRTIKPMKPLG